MSNGEYKLKTMIVDELPLIAFTTCAPAALGVAFVALVEGIVAFSSTGLWFGGWRFAALAVVFTTVGMLASVMHLAKPLRAPRSLANVRSSALSRDFRRFGVLGYARRMARSRAHRIGDASVCARRCLYGARLGLALPLRLHRRLRRGATARLRDRACLSRYGTAGVERPRDAVRVACRRIARGRRGRVLPRALAAEYMDVPLSPWIAALISVVCIGVAIALDKYASNARMHRLSLEIDAGANPHGRVPAALSCVVTWQAERGYGFALSFSAACFIVLACLVPAFRIIAVVLAMLCVLVAQAMHACGLLRLLQPSRTPRAFRCAGKRQARGQSPRLHA